MDVREELKEINGLLKQCDSVCVESIEEGGRRAAFFFCKVPASVVNHIMDKLQECIEWLDGGNDG